ncbi:MAG: hypothetical protein VCB81_05900 [Verrucomicrobiia bacterium]
MDVLILQLLHDDLIDELDDADHAVARFRLKDHRRGLPCWRNLGMILRWGATFLLVAEQGFRRIQGPATSPNLSSPSPSPNTNPSFPTYPSRLMNPHPHPLFNYQRGIPLSLFEIDNINTQTHRPQGADGTYQMGVANEPELGDTFRTNALTQLKGIYHGMVIRTIH